MAELDLTDPEVREMARTNHVPKEWWSPTGVLLSVHCDECGHRWPCGTRERLRTHETGGFR